MGIGFLLLLISSAQLSQAGPLDDLASLRMGRSYIRVTVLSPMGHQFEATFLNSEIEHGNPWTTAHVRAPLDSSDNRYQYIKVESRLAVDPGLSKPENFDVLKKGVEAAILRQVPKSKIHQIRYLGAYSRVVLHQITPLAPKSHGDRRRYRVYKGIYYIQRDGLPIRTSMTKYTVIPKNVFEKGPNGIRQFWLDYVLPSEIEGSALLDLSDWVEMPGWDKSIYEDARRSLFKKLAETLAAKEKVPSLADILRKQSTTALPLASEQFLKWTCTLQGEQSADLRSVKMKLENLFSWFQSERNLLRKKRQMKKLVLRFDLKDL